jgi:hypothetical protein
MREYLQNIHHKSKEDKERERLEALKLIHQLNKEKKEREMHMKEIFDR